MGVDYARADNERQTTPALALPIGEDERPTIPSMPPLVVSWRDIPRDREWSGFGLEMSALLAELETT